MTDDALSALVDAANHAVEIGALDNRYVVLTEEMLRLLGRELLRATDPGERFQILVAAQVGARSKLSPGALLITDTRAVVCWSENLARPRSFSVSCRLVDVHDVEHGRRRAGLVSANLDSIRFWAGPRLVELVLSTPIIDPELVRTLLRMLTGRSTTTELSDGLSGESRGLEHGIAFDPVKHPRGALVSTVGDSSGVVVSGLEPGMVVTHVEGHRVEDPAHAARLIDPAANPYRIELSWWRDGRTGIAELTRSSTQALSGPRGTSASPVALPTPDRSPETEFAAAYALAQRMPEGSMSQTMTPGDVDREGQFVLDAFVRGDLDLCWRRRLAIGQGVPTDGADRTLLFWLDAAPAIAALHLGLRDHPLVWSLCGVAESHADRSDPGQAVAVREFNLLFHGHLPVVD